MVEHRCKNIIALFQYVVRQERNGESRIFWTILHAIGYFPLGLDVFTTHVYMASHLVSNPSIMVGRALHL